MPVNALLDTCALLWLARRDSNLSPVVRQAIEKADLVYVSAVSAWELGLKFARGKLEFPVPLKEWYPAVLVKHRLQELPLTGALGIAATQLPALHADPADRLLIATALEHGLTLLTPDRHITQYPNLKTLW